jgi:hypothetical protein
MPLGCPFSDCTVATAHHAATLKDDKIYYFIGKDRKMAEESPYMEALLQKGVQVLYSYEPLDDVVFSNTQSYKGKYFVSVETNSVDVDLGGVGCSCFDRSLHSRSAMKGHTFALLEALPCMRLNDMLRRRSLSLAG